MVRTGKRKNLMNAISRASTSVQDFVVNKCIKGDPHHPWLRNGDQYRESLRDGRRVIMGSRDVEDVTAEPTLKSGIATLGSYFDSQVSAATQDLMTTVDTDTGNRYSTAWLVPKSIEDLKRYDAMIRHS